MRFIALGVSIMALAGIATAQVGPKGDKRDLKHLDVPDIIRFMLRSLPNWRYAGERLVEVKDGAKRNLGREFVLRDGPRSRTSFPKDSPRYGEVIVETPFEKQVYNPAKNTIIVTHGRGVATDRLNSLMRRGSHFQDEKADRVANRDTRVVAVSDEKGRVYQRIWIDAKAGVILKRELYDQVGAREGYFEFKQIDFSPRYAPGDFKINVPGVKIVTPYDQAKELAASMGMTPLFLPRDKFPLEGARIIQSPAGAFLHLSFAAEDGLVSLFQAKGRIAQDRLMPPNRMNRLQFVTWVANGNSYALVGRGSRERLEGLARGLGMQ
jgi:outer membrane lipoprotein-sorting protein